MKLNEGEIKTIFPANNHVLVKPLIDTSKVQTKSGSNLLVDTTYLPENHARAYCEVVSLPKSLIYDKRYPGLSMEWKCDMMLKIGDKVLVKYLDALTAEQYHHVIDEFGEKYYIMPYQSIYLIMRENETIMLNGYVLVEGIKQEKHPTIEILEKYEDHYGIVRYCHEPNHEYFTGEIDADIINPGDKVVLSYPYMHYKRLEPPMHRVFSKETEYLVLQRHQLSCVLKI